MSKNLANKTGLHQPDNKRQFKWTNDGPSRYACLVVCDFPGERGAYHHSKGKNSFVNFQGLGSISLAPPFDLRMAKKRWILQCITEPTNIEAAYEISNNVVYATNGLRMHKAFASRLNII